jgi:hypothetical protein
MVDAVLALSTQTDNFGKGLSMLEVWSEFFGVSEHIVRFHSSLVLARMLSVESEGYQPHDSLVAA